MPPSSQAPSAPGLRSSAPPVSPKTLIHLLRIQAKTLATLALLALVFPFNAGVVLLAWIPCRIRLLIRRFLSSPDLPHPPETVLLTGGKMTKALQLARSFARSGHRVILVETQKYWLSGHRFSEAVARFYTVPDPKLDPQGYIEALVSLAQRESVSVFVPVSSPVGSYFDAKVGELLAQTQPNCRVVQLGSKTILTLDNKFQFCQLAASWGLPVPKHHYITDPEQVLRFDFASDPGPYILKSIPYDSVSRLDLKRLPCEEMESYLASLPISVDHPWILQELITGQEFCTHSMLDQGSMRLHTCARSSPFQVNYAHVDHAAIQDWVAQFAQQLAVYLKTNQKEPATGQLSFDFIETADGSVYPIECNPRTHSAMTLFYNHPDLAAAYLNPTSNLISNPMADSTAMPITPLATAKPVYWLYHELWRLTEVRSWTDLKHRIQTLWRGKEALWESWDPLPFLLVPHWQITLLLLQNLTQAKGWVRIDFNIGKLVEPGGD